ncbi:TIM44-like domain-containing protein [Acidisoma cellulosilytica]|uniref:TIM44-like domain-containing protein n=1 Tax=Acidisoma cellulosilyticum TaxID=2802395 RepID=A0A963YYB2_9PROT|nr:TIM44-like domain-containing protein [Acidisoma cellulosilyticum]MCB8879205.1 TIM44-like domain-containing protein [Acidisoma cellulosilyticum]
MRRFLMITAALIPLMGAVGIDTADARLGGGHSMGSRGSFSYRPPRPTSIAPGAAPFERSQAPAAGLNNRGFGAQGGNFAQRRPFMTGLMGGLIGAGIFGLLFGGGFMHMGLGFGGLFGVLIQLVILFFIVRFLFRLFAGRRSSQPSIFGAMGRQGMGRQTGGIGPGQEAMGPSVQPLQLTPADRQAFAQCLAYVQQAWGAGDLRAISQAATPEMMGYFQDQLNTLSRQGLRNRVSDVQMDGMELSEAWSEGDTDFATVAMRFSMIDVTEDRTGRIVDGDPNVRALVSEIWTFTRRRGSHWVLAAIQQTN